MAETQKETPEQKAAREAAELAAAKVEIIERCTKAGHTKGITEDERSKVANEPEFLAVCRVEREDAKAAVLKRNEARIKELGSKLKPGETLEEYDTRTAREKK